MAILYISPHCLQFFFCLVVFWGRESNEMVRFAVPMVFETDIWGFLEWSDRMGRELLRCMFAFERTMDAIAQ